MDKPLQDYLNFAQSLHDMVTINGINMRRADIENSLNQLRHGIKLIQAVARYMADISNTIMAFGLNVKNINIPTLNPYPKSTDHAQIRLANKSYIKEVSSEDLIPVQNIYYIRKKMQYAINIGGVIIKGNLCNVTDDAKTAPILLCKRGNTCDKLKQGACKYFHEPEDYIFNKLPINPTRTISNTSWIYAPNSHKNTRKIGNKATLTYDIAAHNDLSSEMSMRQYQLIHDLIVFLIATGKGKNTACPGWQSH